MTKLEWRAQQVIKKMEEEWKVVTLSRECSANIDHQLAMALAPIKEEFRQKEKTSRAYIAKIEATTAEV